MMGSNIYDEKMNELDIDMNKRSVFGSEFITLYTKVQSNFSSLESSYKSFSANLDEIRPVAGGESKCKMLKAPSRSKFVTGFTPNIHGYNGENGLIQQMTLYQCRPEVDYRRQTGECEEDQKAGCSQVIFVWRPGGGGETFPGEAGIERGDRKLMLEVVYNSGTGWLYDQSGLEVFYSQHDLTERVGKVTMWGRRQEPSGLVTGLCAGGCMGRTGAVTVLSVSLHGQEEGSVSLASEAGLLVSGYRQEYQPTRHLVEAVEAKELELRCSGQCWAVITILRPPELNLTQCGTESSGESYCVSGTERRSLGETLNCSHCSHTSLRLAGLLDMVGDGEESEECQRINNKKINIQSSGDDEAVSSLSTTEIRTSAAPTEAPSSTGMSDMSDTIKLHSVNFNSLNNQTESSTSPTMKIDIAIVEETSPSLPEELEEIADLEINDIDTIITQEIDLDIPESSNVTFESLSEDITEIPDVNVDSDSTEFAEEIKLNSTRESRFLENASPSGYLSEKDGQINFSKVYRSEASTTSYFGSILVVSSISTFLL